MAPSAANAAPRFAKAILLSLRRTSSRMRSNPSDCTPSISGSLWGCSAMDAVSENLESLTPYTPT